MERLFLELCRRQQHQLLCRHRPGSGRHDFLGRLRGRGPQGRRRRRPSLRHQDALPNYTNNRVGVSTATPDEELEVAGDVEVSGHYYYNHARKFYKYIGSEEFLPWSGGVTSFRQETGFKYSNVDTAQLAFGPVDLPSGADVTEVRCYYQDDHPETDIEQTQFVFYARALSSEDLAVLGLETVFPGPRDSTMVEDFADTSVSGAGDPIDNLSYVYFIQFYMDLPNGSSPSQEVNFRGCRVTYSLEHLSY